LVSHQRFRKTFAEADPNFTIINVRTMQEQVDLNFDQQAQRQVWLSFSVW